VKTPIRAHLLQTSSLHGSVQDGLQALARDDRSLIESDCRRAFTDSLDLDRALQAQFPGENRWDYLLGHGSGAKVVGLEPHTATNHEIKVVLQKRKSALRHLRDHLRPGRQVEAWYWVASGRVDFVPHERATLLLAQGASRSWAEPLG
jgi:hypothetical protein